MENMKAVQVHNYGGPEVLRFEDAPRPAPGSGELLIRVHAASVNAIDWKARAGYLKDIFPLPLPYIPGWDDRYLLHRWHTFTSPDGSFSIHHSRLRGEL